MLELEHTIISTLLEINVLFLKTDFLLCFETISTISLLLISKNLHREIIKFLVDVGFVELRLKVFFSKF